MLRSSPIHRVLEVAEALQSKAVVQAIAVLQSSQRLRHTKGPSAEPTLQTCHGRMFFGEKNISPM